VQNSQVTVIATVTEYTCQLLAPLFHPLWGQWVGKGEDFSNQVEIQMLLLMGRSGDQMPSVGCWVAEYHLGRLALLYSVCYNTASFHVRS